jgi:short subunit dehydrogenase
MSAPASRLFDVTGARALVTGAASGLGQAFAEVLADSGARVTLADIDAERLGRVTAELADRGGDVRAAHVDVTDPGAVDAPSARPSRRMAGSTSSSRTPASPPFPASAPTAGRSCTPWPTTSGSACSRSTSTACCTRCAPPRP